MAQVLVFLSEVFILSLIFIATAYFIYLLFEKSINSFIAKIVGYQKEIKKEKLQNEYILRQNQIEADRKKVEKIRSAYSDAMRQGGHAYTPYYTAKSA